MAFWSVHVWAGERANTIAVTTLITITQTISHFDARHKVENRARRPSPQCKKIGFACKTQNVLIQNISWNVKCKEIYGCVCVCVSNMSRVRYTQWTQRDNFSNNIPMTVTVCALIVNGKIYICISMVLLVKYIENQNEIEWRKGKEGLLEKWRHREKGFEFDLESFGIVCSERGKR